MLPMDRDYWLEYIARTPKGRKTNRRPIANNTYVRSEEGGCVYIRLHNTDIITLNTLDQIILDSGGWLTVTTKDRMNRFNEGMGYCVFSEQGIWYVSFNAKDYYFENGMILSLELPSEGRKAYVEFAIERDKSKEKELRKLKRRINTFCRTWAKKFVAGEIEKPGNGDCFMCQFTPQGKVSTLHKDGTTTPGPTCDHLISHMDEKYYVPSLLPLAMTHPNAAAMLSQWAKSEIYMRWQATDEEKKSLNWTGEWGHDITERQIAKCLNRYFRKEFGFSQW